VYWVLVKAGVFRKKVRSLLTTFSVIVAFFLYGLLHSADPLFDGAVGEINAERMIMMPKHDMMFGRIPQSHINYLESIDSVTDVAWIDMLSMDINSMMENIPIFAISDDYFEVMDRFKASANEKEAFFSNRTGALVGKAAADIKGWKPGDLISIPTFSAKNDGSNVWEFYVEGIYTTSPAADELGIMVRHEYVEEARANNKGTVSMIIFNLDDPTKADQISNIIDNNFKNSAYATFTGNEITLSQKMLSDIGNIKLIITSIISAVFFTLLLVTANTMSQSVRERTSDIAILKSLGYKDMQIFISILLESNFIILIGAAFGLGFTVMTVPLIDQASGGLTGGLIVFDIFQVLRGILIGVLMASLAGILPAYQAYKLKVVDALAKG